MTQNKVVATQTLGSLLQILAFMGFGLITRMVLTHQIVILTIPSIKLRYFEIFFLFFFSYIIVFWHGNYSKLWPVTSITRGVHQTAQTALKPPVKWHNRIAPQVIVHRTAPHSMVQCGLRFYNKKTAQTAPSLCINIFIYF